MLFTVFGGTGFIGSHVTSYLESQGHEVRMPRRHEEVGATLLGHVIFAEGILVGASARVAEIVKVHIDKPRKIIKSANYESFLYLSTAKLYQDSDEAIETSPLEIANENIADIYTVSKLFGESVCLNIENPFVRVARISTVIGRNAYNNTFVYDIIDQATKNRSVVFSASASSERDYVAVSDVATVLEKISIGGKHRVYNVASGQQISHRTFADVLARLTGSSIRFEAGATTMRWPSINTQRIENEFQFLPRDPLKEFENILVHKLRRHDGT